MSVTYGLTDSGFVIKTLQTIRDDINSALKTAFGSSIDTGDRSILGQLAGIVAERLALLWELAQTVYAAQDPNLATGAGLDAVSAYTGTLRPPASYSVVTETLTGIPTTVVPSGSLIKTASTSQQFQTTASGTIASVSAWTTGLAYALGDRVTNGGNVYQCVTAGTAGATAPTGTSTGISDGGAAWDWLGAGTGAVDVTAQCTVTGPVTATARDLSVRVSGVTGWDGAINVLDATLGRNVASDEELRVLREEELSSDGQSPPDALRAALLKITDVVSATVFTNITDTTDANGMPPHSVECMVRTLWSAGDPKDQEIFDAVFQNLAAGIESTSTATTGKQTGTATDSQGTSHTVYWSRPDEVPIYTILNVTVDASKFPTDGATEIATAITTWAAGFDTGRDAVASAISAQAFSVAGVLDVTSCFIGTAPSPASAATVSISQRQLATFDSSRITVNVTTGTP